MPTKERPNEKIARWIVSRVLECRVSRFEDGKQDSQVDALIHPTGGDPVGMEIVGDHDPDFNEQWSAMDKINHKIEVPGLRRRWSVSLSRSARVKTLVRVLPDLMLRLEAGDITWSRWQVPEEFAAIGVQSAHPIDDQRSGIVHLNAEGWSGIAGEPQLSPWIQDMFARHPDVPTKLAAHPSREGHAFLWVTTVSDYAVQFTLEDRSQGLPTDRPDLPDGVTHVWVASSLTSQGVVAWFPDRGWWRTPWQWPDEPLLIPDSF